VNTGKDEGTGGAGPRPNGALAAHFKIKTKKTSLRKKRETKKGRKGTKSKKGERESKRKQHRKGGRTKKAPHNIGAETPRGGGGFKARPRWPAGWGETLEWVDQSKNARKAKGSNSQPAPGRPGSSTWGSILPNNKKSQKKGFLGAMLNKGTSSFLVPRGENKQARGINPGGLTPRWGAAAKHGRRGGGAGTAS